ncbi:MAG: hypothetical protein ACFCU1_04540 [Sumerlaeia bacterium]
MLYKANASIIAMALLATAYTQAAVTVIQNPEPSNQFAFFGAAFVVVPDQNGDSVEDIIIGSSGGQLSGNPINRPGRANVISGADGTLISTIEPPIPTEQANFGNPNRMVDFTGDSVPEFAIREPRLCDTCAATPTSGLQNSIVPNPYPGIWDFRYLGNFSCSLRFPFSGPAVADAGYLESSATIYRSTDGGVTWQPVPTTVNTAGDFVETSTPVTAFSQWTIGFTQSASVENWWAHE